MKNKIGKCETNPRSRRQRGGECDDIKRAIAHEKESGANATEEKETGNAGGRPSMQKREMDRRKALSNPKIYFQSLAVMSVTTIAT